MNFFELIKERHSVRSFQKKKIPKEELRQIFTALNSAPSAGNLQAFEVVLVEKEETKQALAKAALGQSSVAKAAAVLVFFQDPERSSVKYRERGGKLYSLQDATIAAAYTQLAAQALGISSCWVGAFNEAGVKQAVKAPKGLIAVALIPLGYTDEKHFATKRRKLKELVHEEKF